MSVMSVSHISKKFGELNVLRDISLQVGKGEVISIIGPSGSGKSTFLRCCTLLEYIDSGSLAYGDLVICKDGQYCPKKVQKEARRHFGLVFQNFNLFPHYSVLRNIMEAPVSVLKRDEDEVREDAMRLLQEEGLEDKADAYPWQLSGGQQQRIAIARALALHPDILFFDEPTSALDPELTSGILKVIRQLAVEKMTMVIVTHEIHFARNVSDRIIFMADGVIVEEGPAKALIDTPSNPRTKAFLAKMDERD